MKRVINVDWLSLYCLSSEAYYHQKVLTSAGFQIRIKDVQSRHFSKIYDVVDLDGDYLLEVQEHPKSLKKNGGIWHENAMIVKISNKKLYLEETINRVYLLLSQCNIKIKSISRLDIAMDINYFDNGEHPQSLIRRFMSDEIWYLFSKKFTCIGKQNQKQTYQYLRFGSAASSYSIYLYNKSLELREQKDKPYIRDIWENVGLNTKDVWRLEVSLKTDAKAIMQYDDKIIKSGSNYVNGITGEVLDKEKDIYISPKGKVYQIERITIDSISSAESIEALYMKLISRLFIFREKIKGKKKKDCPNIEYVNKNRKYINYRPCRITYATTSGRTEKVVMNYLDKLVSENEELLTPVFHVKREIIKSTGYEKEL